MNPNDEPREPVSTKAPASADEVQYDDERVEVLVEDLFIEAYPPPSPAPAPAEAAPDVKRGRLARAVSPLRGRKKSVLSGLLSLGALAVVSLLFGGRRRRQSRVARMFHRLGFV